MNLDQKVKLDYEPIEPKSYFPKKLKSIIKEIGIYVLAAEFFITPFAVALVNKDLNEGKTRDQIEEGFKFNKDDSLTAKLLKYPLIISKPGRELGYYLHEKGLRIKFN